MFQPPNQLNQMNFADPNAWVQMMFGQEAHNQNQSQNQQGLQGWGGIDITGKYPAYMASKYLTSPEYVSLVNQYATMLQLQPHETEALMQMMDYLANPEKAAQAYRDQTQAAYTDQLPEMQSNLLAQGAGQGVKEGMALHQQNAANREGSSYAANLFSPKGLAQSAAGVHNIYQMSQPDLGRLGQLTGIQTGTPQSQSFLQQLGGIAGQAAGGGAFNGLF